MSRPSISNGISDNWRSALALDKRYDALAAINCQCRIASMKFAPSGRRVLCGKGSDRVPLSGRKAIANSSRRNLALPQTAIGLLEMRDHVVAEQLVMRFLGGLVRSVVVEQQETTEATVRQ